MHSLRSDRWRAGSDDRSLVCKYLSCCITCIKDDLLSVELDLLLILGFSNVKVVGDERVENLLLIRLLAAKPDESSIRAWSACIYVWSMERAILVRFNPMIGFTTAVKSVSDWAAPISLPPICLSSFHCPNNKGDSWHAGQHHPVYVVGIIFHQI